MRTHKIKTGRPVGAFRCRDMKGGAFGWAYGIRPYTSEGRSLLNCKLSTPI
ncbi:MAG: hypothetical protein F6J93_14740 [Oscillatoria sp. SIO1A7]|nr:hypothetical protein [Oscillatoria sp. SIO1A7]